ncbi:MAG: hypothetical protein CVV06_17235 [Gammaproteobacteria bacterium HGW-Gammaproteobacteria-10]|nr:MAG: hypothetical protein CVV06_17235 [Gammaproteobacteria bacterium HGW-Gammaproteobacteria-10]
MLTMKSRIFIPFLSICLFSAATLAEKRHHDAHTHGAAELNIVIENDIVLIEFESPAVNLIGFEHKPRTDAQQRELQNALALLNDVEILVSFEKGECRATETHIRGPFDDDDQEGSEHGEQEEHSEFHATYTLSCQNASAINSVRTQLFDRFPGFEAIRVRWVASKGHGTALLNNHSTTFSIE